MKTKLFLSIVTALVISSNLFAGNPKTNVYSNVIDTETGYNKEHIIFKYSNMQMPVKKDLSVYDANGTLLQKTTYVWNSNTGWVENNKREYTYNNSDKPSTVAFTLWDKQTKDWAKTTEIRTYEEDRANMTLVVTSENIVKKSTDLAINKTK